MKTELENQEEQIARALRQLSVDHQKGRLSLIAYRRLRRNLLDKADRGDELLPLPAGTRVRPGIVVWFALLAIVLLLTLLGWLLR